MFSTINGFHNKPVETPEKIQVIRDAPIVVNPNEHKGKTIIGSETPLQKYGVDTYLQLSSDNADHDKEVKIHQRQKVLEEQLFKENSELGFDLAQKNLPWNGIGYEGVNNTLQITIDPKYFTDENISKYVEKIRNLVGDEIDISIYPKDYPDYRDWGNNDTYVADDNGNVTLTEHDSSVICSVLGFPCPLDMRYTGKLLDENNVLVKITGSDDYDVKLNQTHVCVTSKTETTCKIR